MKFLLYAQANCHYGTENRYDATDRTYVSLMKAFASIMRGLGEVLELSDPLEAEQIYENSVLQGEECALLSFAPPHMTPLELTCPVIPVFCWEYPNIPERIEETSWGEDPRHDWRFVLAKTGRAIVLSMHARDAIRHSMGSHYPVLAMSWPVNPIDQLPGTDDRSGVIRNTVLTIQSAVADSRQMGLNADAIVNIGDEDGTSFNLADVVDLPPIEDAIHRRSSALLEARSAFVESGSNERWPHNGWDIPPVTDISTRLHGLVYTAVVTPSLEQENWEDLLTGFCWSFRDTEDATLILLLDDPDPALCHLKLVMILSKLSPMKCRVLSIYAPLQTNEYRSLIEATSYYLSTSLAAKSCRYLNDFLAAGVPAIAPAHTAFADLINDDLALVIRSTPGVPRAWPHGDRDIYRTSWQQLDWQSFVDVLHESRSVAMRDSSRYMIMAAHARQNTLSHCGSDVVHAQLRQFLCSDNVAATSNTAGHDKHRTIASVKS